jgi:hypothetical protein
MLDILRIPVEMLKWSISFDAAVQCCTLVAFWGQVRLRELLPTSKAAFDAFFFPACTSWSQSGLASIHLPWTKMTKMLGAHVLLQLQSSCTCPILSLMRLFSSYAVEANAHLCACTNSNRAVLLLTKQAFLEQINNIWEVPSVALVTGHSFWIGRTTELLHMGVLLEVVKVAEQWDSDSFYHY